MDQAGGSHGGMRRLHLGRLRGRAESGEPLQQLIE